MIKDAIEIMERVGIEIEPGLSAEEFKKIESVYGISFPEKWKELLMMVLPISKGFYNWRDFSTENISYIKSILNQPFEGIAGYANEVEWCEQWGDSPGDSEKIAIEVKWRLRDAPKLIPVYSHRFVPMIDSNDPPVLSVHGTDVIRYGNDLEDYFRREFLKAKKNNTQLAEEIEFIPFWSEIM